MIFISNNYDPFHAGLTSIISFYRNFLSITPITPQASTLPWKNRALCLKILKSTDNEFIMQSETTGT